MGRRESVKDAWQQFSANAKAIPGRLRERMFLAQDANDLMAQQSSEGSNEMRKNLTAFDALFFGIGCIVGAGIFVITGVAARDYAGPAVAISFILAALSAFLSAICYSEFAVEMPIAGGAFSYLLVTFGEFPAFITVSNILLEYILSSAAVARGFTSYFASLCGQNSDAFRIQAGNLELDPLAVLVIGLLVALLCYGTKDSSIVNSVVSILTILVILFVILAGFIEGKAENVTRNFKPYGNHGVVNAAALVFFSFVGFDAVATLAEEVQKPARDLPVGIIGSVSIVTVLYVFMSLSLCLMVPYQKIDLNAPFSTAFSQIAGWRWARYVVALGAVMGILTSLLVSLLAQARITMVMSRAHLLPKAFAHVHEKTRTPVASTIGLGAVTALIAFFTSLETLTNMVSIGTLFIFLMVAAALLYRRSYIPGQKSPVPILCHLAAILVSSLGLGISYQRNSSMGPAVFFTLWFLTTLSLWIFIPEARRPEGFVAPSMPWLASFSMLLNVFLLATLDYRSYYRLFIWTIVTILVYVFYGVHATYGADDVSRRLATHHNSSEQTHSGRESEVEMEPVELGSSVSDRDNLWGYVSSSVDPDRPNR